MLAACGAVNGCHGLYICTDSPAKLNGVSVDEEWIELSRRGRGTLHLMGEDYALKWSLDGEELTLTHSGTEYTGFLSDGVITVSFSDMLYTYVRDGAETPTGEEPESDRVKLNALQKWWNGQWYGWWRITDGEGDWHELNGSWYDCCARLELDATGRGSMSLWDASGSLCTVQLALTTEDAGSRFGAARSIAGYFWSWRIGEDDWVLDPAASGYEYALSLSGGYYEDENGSFRYDFFLRPWGQLWDDVAVAGANSLPDGYYDWYLPLLESGKPMPDSLSK